MWFDVKRVILRSCEAQTLDRPRRYREGMLPSCKTAYYLSVSAQDLPRRMSSASKRRRRMERDCKRKRNEVTAQEDKCMQLEECLLPGIGNEVTLDLIAAKLPWTTLHVLSSVSPAWRQAMQNRLVYDARVRADSGDSFVIISDTKLNSFDSQPTGISLYSLRNNTCYQLPPIPQVDSGFPYACDCIALDGKVYILGGSKESSHKVQRLGSKDVYVLDVAGRRQWKPCARMQEARANFKCGAKDGKIYVFGGTCEDRRVLGSEVYDPSLDAWSSIKPRGSWPPKNKSDVDGWSVIRAGEESLVSRENSRRYYTVRDMWKISDRFPLYEDCRHFIAQGELHSMSLSNIRVYDIEKNEWTERYSCSFAAVPHLMLWPIAVLAVDKEILTVTHRWTGKGGCFTCLIRSKGFGSDDKEIVWEELSRSLSIIDYNPSMSLLKL